MHEESDGVEMQVRNVRIDESNLSLGDSSPGNEVEDFKHHPAAVRRLLSDESFHAPKQEGTVWSSRLSYLLAAVGSAVGLGNIWRFPYLCYRNGGACFLIPYAIAFCTLGVPLLALETGLGQGLGKSALGAFEDLSPRLKGLGWVCFVSTCGIVVYYNVVLAWCLRYFLASFSALTPDGLPWQNGRSSQYFQGTVLDKAFFCGLANDTSSVLGEIEYRDAVAASALQQGSSYVDPWAAAGGAPYIGPRDPLSFGQAQWATQILGYSCTGASFNYQGDVSSGNAWALVGIWLITLGMCIFGTSSLKWTLYITVPLPYLMLIVLFFRGITLDGAGTGLAYYMLPDMSRLFVDRVDPDTGQVSPAVEVWMSAVSQIFFSLSLGQGAMITYASYNPPHYPIFRNVLTVAVINSGTELFGGVCVFSILGYLSKQKGVPIQDVVAAGPGLVFEVIPEALSLMPFPGLFCMAFFLMLLLLGLTSAVSLVEAAISIARDQLASLAPRHPAAAWLCRTRGALPSAVCVALFFCGLALCGRSSADWVDLIDGFISNYLLTLVGLLEFVAVGWIFGSENFGVVMAARTGWRPSARLGLMWRYVGPAMLSVLFTAGVISSILHPVTDVGWALAVGYLLTLLPIAAFAALAYTTPLHHHDDAGPALLARPAPAPAVEADDTPPRPDEV